jgi:hypothetical protein
VEVGFSWHIKIDITEMRNMNTKETQWVTPTVSEFDIAEHTLLGIDFGSDGIEGEVETGNGGVPGS